VTKNYRACPVCQHHDLGSMVSRDNGKYLLITPPRTGSTVVYQILEKIQKSSTIKTHSMKGVGDCPLFTHYEGIFVTIRHPYDSFASYIKMTEDIDPENVSLKNSQLTFEEFDKAYDTTAKILLYNSIVHLYYEQPNDDQYGLNPPIPFFIRYEDSIHDPAYRVEEIFKYLQIDASHQEMSKIAEEFSIENNQRMINSGNNRDDRSLAGLDKSGFVFKKNHIGPDAGMSRGKSLPNDIRKKIYSKYTAIFEIFGYNA